MPILRKGDATVLFVHVPKTGGTSLENLFRASGWEVSLHDSGRVGSLNKHRWCSPQHMHASALADRFRLASFDSIFMVVRNPLSRFRSELLMRNPGLTGSWSLEAEAFTRKMLRNYLNNPHIADNHIRPQGDFYVPGSKVFRFESGMDRVAKDLRDVHGLDLDLSRGVPHDRARAGSTPSNGIEFPVEVARDLVQFYRDDFFRFDYSVPPFTG